MRVEGKLPSVADIHVRPVCEPSEMDQSLEPLFEIAGEGAGEGRVGEETVLFCRVGISLPRFHSSCRTYLLDRSPPLSSHRAFDNGRNNVAQ